MAPSGRIGCAMGLGSAGGSPCWADWYVASRREVGGDPAQPGRRGRRVGRVQPGPELVDAEPPGGVMLTELLRHGLAFSVADAPIRPRRHVDLRVPSLVCR